MGKLDSTVQTAKEDFEGKSVVGFVGERFSGKTVIMAILKHALVNHFISDDSEWNAWVTSGSTRINDILKKLTNEEFPSPTLPGDAKPINLEIFSKAGTGKGIEITLQDMAGESRDKFLRAEYDNENQRLQDIFLTSPVKGKPYGLLAHLAFAKIYLIIVDCGKYKDWEHEQSYLANTIRTLSLIKKRVGKDMDGKIGNPIAIIFSKYDRLPKEEQKSPEDLLKKLPEFISTLNIIHKGERKLFVSKIKSVLRTKKELDALITKEVETKNKDLIEAKNEIKDKEVILQNATNELQDINQDLTETKKKLSDAQTRKVPEEIQNATNEVEEKEEKLEMAQQTYENIAEKTKNAKLNLSEIQTRLKNEHPSAKDLGISEFKPVKPLKYNVEQYLDLISWIIEVNKE